MNDNSKAAGDTLKTLDGYEKMKGKKLDRLRLLVETGGLDSETLGELRDVIVSCTYDDAYDVLVGRIHKSPTTWLPALMLEAAETAYRKSVFQPHGASRIVASMEAEKMQALLLEAATTEEEKR